MDDLNRFKKAQDHADTGFACALAELKSGKKRSHWIWYIFPQLAGLGHSPMAVHYGLRGVSEATEYLRDPMLRARLLAVNQAVATQLARHPTPTLVAVMGSKIDASKVVSSLTLFRTIARRLHEQEPHAELAALAQAADAVLLAAAAQGIPECPFTRAQLKDPPASPPQ